MEEEIFCGALNTSSLDVGTTSLTVPVCRRDSLEVGTFEMIGSIAAVANDARTTMRVEGEFAGGAGCRLEEHLARPLHGNLCVMGVGSGGFTERHGHSRVPI